MTSNWNPEEWFNIPLELRERPQWMVAKDDKVPRSVRYGEMADIRFEPNWVSFKEAYAFAEAHHMWVGFCFTAGADLTCIDVDNKADADTEPELHAANQERMRAIYRQFDSYIEESKSGNGLHILVRGEIGAGVRASNIEVYSQERFIIMTGNVQKDRPLLRDDELVTTMVASLREHQNLERVELQEVDAAESNEQLCARILSSKSGDKFRKLVSAEWAQHINENTGEPYGNDPSGADIAFATLLGFFTKSNRQICEVFSFTPLRHRLKDGRPRHPALDNFLRHTIAKARAFLARDAQSPVDFRAALDAMLAEKLAASALPINMAAGNSPPTSANSNLPPLANFNRFKTKRAKEVLAEPAIEWAVQDLFQSHAVNAIYGWSGVGKSFIALDMAAAVADGVEWFGYKTLQMPVLYVAIEGGNALNQRLGAFEKGNGHEYPENVEFYRGHFHLTDVDLMSNFILARKLAGWAGGMIIIDTFAKATVGLDENTASDMGKVVQALELLKEQLNACVVIVHHSTKPDPKTGIAGSMRGSGSLQAGIEGVFEVARQPIFGEKQDGEKEAPIVGHRRFVRANKVKEGDDQGFHYFELSKVMLDRFDNFGTQLSSCFIEPEKQYDPSAVNSPIAPIATNAPTYSAAERATGNIGNAPFGGAKSKRQAGSRQAPDTFGGMKPQDAIRQAIIDECTAAKSFGKYGGENSYCAPRSAIIERAIILRNYPNPSMGKRDLERAADAMLNGGKLGSQMESGKIQWLWIESGNG